MNASQLRMAMSSADLRDRPSLRETLNALANLLDLGGIGERPVEQLYSLATRHFALREVLAAADDCEVRPFGARHGPVFVIPNVGFAKTPQTGPSEALDNLIAQLRLLHAEIERKLCHLMNVGAMQLVARLTDVFGTALTDHGRNTDANANPLHLSAIERAQRRVIFRGGRAYYLRQLLGRPAHEALLDTTQLEDRPNSGKNESYQQIHRPKAWGFVLSLDQVFYVTQHGFVHQGAETQKYVQPRFFHSSYLSGSRVLCAGDCVVERGLVTSISNASGHYQPSQESLAYVVEALRRNGMNTSALRVVAFESGDDLSDFHDDEHFMRNSVPAFEYVQHLRGGVSSGHGLAAVPAPRLVATVTEGLASYGRRIHWNQSADSKKAVAWLNRLLREERERNAGGQSPPRQLAAAVSFLIGRSKSPGEQSYDGLPLKPDSSLYLDLTVALKKLPTMVFDPAPDFQAS